MNLTTNIMRRLSKFFDSYKEKTEFLKGLSRKRKGADEIILLVCCYIDQLGGCLLPEAGSSKRNFELMLLKHSGESDEFSRISIADLGTDILYAAEIADYIIQKPGRLQLPREDLKPLIKFVDETGIALTGRRFRRLLLDLHDTLKSRFRIHANQTKNKDAYGYEEGVIDLILGSSRMRHEGATITEDNIKGLIKGYSYASILYREYRCKAVHEAAGIYVDARRFWNLKRPYFTEWYGVFTGWTLKLEFPSKFLIACLETCIECSERAVKGKGLLPLAIWSAICEPEEFEFLDAEGIKEERPIKLRIE